MKVFIWIVVVTVIILYFIVKILKRSGFKKENGITWFYQAFELYLFYDNPELKNVDEEKLLIASGYFHENISQDKNIQNKILLHDIKLAAKLAVEKDSRRGNSLVYFIQIMKAMEQYSLKNPNKPIKLDEQEFKNYLNNISIEKIAKTVQKHLRDEVAPKGHLIFTKKIIEKHPNWYESEFE